MHGSAFAKALGIDMKPLDRNEPTELPAIEVSDMMMDNLFLLTDGSYVIIDYESNYSEENKIKYLSYLARLVKTLYNRNKKIPSIQIVVIYTADVKAGSTNPVINLGKGMIPIQEIFLSGWDTEEILRTIEQKIICKRNLTEVEKVRLIMVPLSAKGRDAKNNTIRRCIDIIEQIVDERLQLMLYGGLLAFTDKVIEAKDQEEIRRRLSMTKIEKIFYDEKIEAVNEKAYTIACNFLKEGLSIDMVSRNTGLDISVVEELSKNLDKEQEKEAMSV